MLLQASTLHCPSTEDVTDFVLILHFCRYFLNKSFKIYFLCLFEYRRLMAEAGMPNWGLWIADNDYCGVQRCLQIRNLVPEISYAQRCQLLTFLGATNVQNFVWDNV